MLNIQQADWGENGTPVASCLLCWVWIPSWLNWGFLWRKKWPDVRGFLGRCHRYFAACLLCATVRGFRNDVMCDRMLVFRMFVFQQNREINKPAMKKYTVNKGSTEGTTGLQGLRGLEQPGLGALVVIGPYSQSLSLCFQPRHRAQAVRTSSIESLFLCTKTLLLPPRVGQTLDFSKHHPLDLARSLTAEKSLGQGVRHLRLNPGSTISQLCDFGPLTSLCFSFSNSLSDSVG